MTLTLHYLNKSRATRVLWLFEELGLDYEVKVYKRDSKTILAPQELSKVHPSGVSPLVEDDGRIYAESGHILDYIVTKYGQESTLIWKNEDEENTIKYALYAAESNISIAGFMIGVHRIAAKKMPVILSSIASKLFSKIDGFYATGKLDKCLKNLDQQIKDNSGFFCNGRFTVADIMYETTITNLLALSAVTQAELDTQYPNVAQWRKKLSEITGKRVVVQKEAELNNQ